MLMIQSPQLLANITLTWTDWSRGGAHLATFGDADITESFFKRIFEDQSCIYNGQPSTICYLFARKFAPSALDPLLGLAYKGKMIKAALLYPVSMHFFEKIEDFH
ncbi:hypothetical protein V6N13_084118 [Hibiscus sabdariffa]